MLHPIDLLSWSITFLILIAYSAILGVLIHLTYKYGGFKKRR